jgi:hypothetical protein
MDEILFVPVCGRLVMSGTWLVAGEENPKTFMVGASLSVIVVAGGVLRVSDGFGEPTYGTLSTRINL